MKPTKHVSKIIKALAFITVLMLYLLPLNAQDLVASWSFEETTGTTTVDASGNGNDGTIVGPTLNATGKVGLAFQYDGIDDYIEIPTSASLDAITSEITLMTWVKTPITGERQGLFERFLCDDPGFRSFILDINNDDGGHLNFGLCAVGANEQVEFILSSGGISDNKWTHVAATSDGTTMKIYINGVLDVVTGDSPAGIFSAGTDLHLGGWEFKTDAWYYPLSGVMDEAKIYNKALSAQDISDEYYKGILVASWSFEETTGTTTVDSSGNGNDGTIVGPTLSATGKVGLAFQYDGVDDYIEIPTSVSLDAITSEITMITWVKTPVNGQRQVLFERFLCDDPGFRSFEFDINNDDGGHLGFNLSGNGTGAEYILSSGGISDNEWTHVAATSDGTTMKIYINGVLDVVTGDSPDGIFSAGTEFHLGGWEFKTDAWYYPLSGIMDEAKIYDKALSAHEISMDYALTEPTGSISGTVTDIRTGDPIEGITVSDGTRSGETDTDGNYTIALVPVNTYMVTASTALVYKPSSVEGVVVTENNTTTLDFVLADSSSAIASWSFEETTGTITVDSSGNGNDGTIVGPTLGETGKVGLAFQYDGVDDYIEIPTSESLDAITSKITLITWVKTPITGERQGLFERFLCDDPGFRSFIFDINNDNSGHLNFGLDSKGDNDDVNFILSSGGISDDEWTHVAATSDGTTMKIYINGVLDAVTGDSPDGIFSAGTDLHLGGWEFKTDAWYYPLTGIMDEAKIYDRALSAREISMDYALTEPTGSISGTVTDNATDDPIKGVAVSDGTRSDITDDDGNYELEYVPVDTGYVVSTTLFGYLPMSVDSVEVTEDNETIVDFSLTESIGTISGTVTDDSTGLAIEGVIVTDGTRSDTTDADGNYILEIVPEETYVVTAAVSGYLIMEIDSVYVSGGDTTIVDFKLIPAADLVGFWPFEETTGTVTADLSMYNNEGATFGTTSTSGISKLAFQFDGATSSVTVPQSTSLDSINDEITMISWVKMPVDTRQTILERWLMNDYAYILEVDDAGKVNFGLCGDGTSDDQVWLTSASSVTADTWTHVAVTSDGTTMKVYIDNVLDANTTAPPSAIHTADGALHMGRWEKMSGIWANPFNGAMDQVKLYNRALTVEEIAYDFVVVGINKNLVLEDGLLEAYPNPFNYSTTISYKTAVAGEVSISIYNLSGQKIHSLVNETQQADHYTVVWDGTNATGGSIGAGVYFYTLNIDNKPVAMNKLVLLK